MADNNEKSTQQQCVDDSTKSKENNPCWLQLFNEIAATVILMISAICVVAAIVIFAIGSKREVVQHEYTYTIKVDSTGNVIPAAQMQVDSIITSIKHHEQIIKDRYDYVLEQRENSQNYLTVGGIFVTVILSIFGFFGYKSFRNIEEDAKSSAKKIAEEHTEEIAKEQATSVALRLNKKLNNRLELEQQKTLNSFKDRDIPDMVSKALEHKFGSVVGDKISKVDEILDKIPAIEKDIVELKRAKDEDALFRAPSRKKRLRLEDLPGIQPGELNNLANKGDSETANKEGL